MWLVSRFLYCVASCDRLIWAIQWSIWSIMSIWSMHILAVTVGRWVQDLAGWLIPDGRQPRIHSYCDDWPPVVGRWGRWSASGGGGIISHALQIGGMSAWKFLNACKLVHWHQWTTGRRAPVYDMQKQSLIVMSCNITVGKISNKLVTSRYCLHEQLIRKVKVRG